MKKLLASLFLILALTLPPFSAFAATDIVNDATLGTNLQACYDLDETSGGRADESANTNDLTDNSTVGSAAGKIDNGADNEASNSEYLSITDGDQTGLALTGDLSFSVWFNVESLSGTNTIFAKTNSNTQRAYVFRVLGSGDGNLLNAEVYGDGTTSNRRGANSDAAILSAGDIGTFVNIAGTFDIDTGAWVFYRNGSSVASTASNAGTVASIYTTPSMFQLGANNFNGTPESYADGVFDIAAVWSKTLTSTDVSNIYNGGAGIPCVGAAITSSVENDVSLFE